MIMMAFVFLSVVRNNVNGAMGRGKSPTRSSAPLIGDVLGAEEIGEYLDY